MLRRVGGSNWIPRLVTDPTFMTAVAQRWKQLRQGVLATAAIEARITALTTPIAAAAERDNVRWPVRSVIMSGGGPTDPTWAGQVEALRTWLRRRTTWLDAQFP